MQCYKKKKSQEILGEERIPPGSHEENNAVYAASPKLEVNFCGWVAEIRLTQLKLELD